MVRAVLGWETMETVRLCIVKGLQVQIQGFPWVICRALSERENFHTCTFTIQVEKRTDFTQLPFALCAHAVGCTHIHAQVHIIIAQTQLKRKMT